MTDKTYYATGRRKTSIARIWITPGEGGIVVNKQPAEEYFGRKTLLMITKQPLEATKTLGKYSVKANVGGGGASSQAGAIRHGLARVLAEIHPEHRPVLKKMGFLTRDPRMKERKKYGQPGARKRFQFSKR